jgi:hypothetical protein
MNRRLISIAGLLAAGLAGCNEPGKRLNAPPHGRSEDVTDLQGTYTYMADNALLEMMTVNDTHFVPRRAELNSLGEGRVSRLASLIDAYGGEIRFDTDSTDADLNTRRLKTITDFLKEAGINTTAVSVRQDMAGGDGFNAAEAMLIRAEKGMYQKGSKSAGPATTGGSSNSSSSNNK